MWQKTLCAFIVATSVGGTVAGAATIPVADGSFETLADPIDGGGHWRPVASVWNPGAGQSQFQQNTSDNITAEDGAFSLWVPNTGGITQDLATTVTAGETLTVTFFGGNGAHAEFGTAGGGLLTATFLVGATPYSQTFDTTTAPSGGWQLFTFTEKIANSGDLKLAFINSGANPWLDNISAVTAAIPEPATLSLTSLASLALIRRRRTA